MKVYEGFFVLPPDAAQDVRKNQLAAVDALIQKAGGKILQRYELGRRPLGYMVQKHKDGFMICIDFEMNPASQEDFRKAVELHEGIIKYMITRKVPVNPEAAPAQPKAATVSAPAAGPAAPSKPAVKKPSSPTTQKVSVN